MESGSHEVPNKIRDWYLQLKSYLRRQSSQEENIMDVADYLPALKRKILKVYRQHDSLDEPVEDPDSANHLFSLADIL